MSSDEENGKITTADSPKITNMVPQCILEGLYDQFLKGKTGKSHLIMPHVQEAYWFYIDYIVPSNGASYSDLSLTDFTRSISPLLHWSPCDAAATVKKFWYMDSKIPRCGGILLNQRKNKILLVRAVNGTRWTFPVGKIQAGETAVECAQREVFEETGYKGVACSAQQVHYRKRKAKYSLFLFYNVPENYTFCAQTRHEIGEIKWFDLPVLDEVFHHPQSAKIQNQIYEHLFIKGTRYQYWSDPKQGRPQIIHEPVTLVDS